MKIDRNSIITTVSAEPKGQLLPAKNWSWIRFPTM